VYVVPATPLIPKVVNVAIPLAAVALCVPTSDPPDEIVAVTIDVESAVTVFPPLSLMVTTGLVLKAAPDALGEDDGVVSAICVATPVETVIDCVTALNPVTV